MVSHYFGRPAINPWLRALIWHGYIAVDLLMILSGFVLAMTLQARSGQSGRKKASIARFDLARLARIYPHYALTTPACVAMQSAGIPVWGIPHLLSRGSLPNR